MPKKKKTKKVKKVKKTRKLKNLLIKKSKVEDKTKNRQT